MFHDSVLRAICRAKPASVAQLEAIRGMSQNKSDRYGADLLALCRGEQPAPANPSERVKPAPKSAPRLTGTAKSTFLTERERSVVQQRGVPSTDHSKTRLDHSDDSRSTHRSPAPESRTPARELTPAEQTFATHLRTWRAEQASATGLPSFFVLSDTALQQLATRPPDSLADLKVLPGFGQDKIGRYGESLLSFCHSHRCTE